jgi:integration host factor subunit alpha
MANKATDDAAEGTLTRASLRDAAYRECTSISRADAREIVDATFDEITEALLRGETVKLTAFGVFKVRSKGERMGRNPRTLSDAIITARRVISFKPSKLLVARVSRSSGKAERDAERS